MAFMDDFRSILLVLGFTGESKHVFRLAIGLIYEKVEKRS